MPEKTLDVDAWLVTAIGIVVTAVIGGVRWVATKLFVNDKRISLLEQEAEQRRRDREEEKAELKEIRGDIKELIKQK